MAYHFHNDNNEIRTNLVTQEGKSQRDFNIDFSCLFFRPRLHAITAFIKENV